MNLKEIKYVAVLVIVITFSLSFSSCESKAEKGYKEAISSADTLLGQDKYQEAKTYYAKALEFKAEEKYPAQKIDEINQILEKQKAETEYKQKLENADNFFRNKRYREAKYAYVNLSALKPGEQYPIDMIKKIEKIQEELKRIEEEMKNPFHVIVGCFKVPSNATKLHKELKSRGYDSKILNRYNGKYEAVIISSHSDIHKAYNNLSNAANQVKEEDAWVLYNK